MSCKYRGMWGWSVHTRWQGWRCGGSENNLSLLIINVPGIIGAASKLMETRGLFRLQSVELGHCVFRIPAEGQMDRWNQAYERRTLKFNGANQGKIWQLIYIDNIAKVGKMQIQKNAKRIGGGGYETVSQTDIAINVNSESYWYSISEWHPHKY